MQTRIIALGNQKGGVGKTTTAVNLTASLAERGQKILLIDFDPQANATSGLGIEKKQGQSMYPVLVGGENLEDKIIPTMVKRLDLIPAEVDLAGAEIEVARSENYLNRVKEALAPLAAKNRYHYIFIDCPPSLGILTMNALTTAHCLVIPNQCEYFALEGLSVMMRLVTQLKESGANPSLEIEGIVMTMYDMRTNLSQQVVQEVITHFGDKVYETLIPRSIRLSEAPSFGKPINIYDKHSTGAAAYRQLAREFLKRRKEAVQIEMQQTTPTSPPPPPTVRKPETIQNQEVIEEEEPSAPMVPSSS